MGFHVCEWCHAADALEKSMQYSPYSSADVILHFASGNVWHFPYVGLPHYVAEHGFLPPEAFIADVMSGQLLDREFMQSKSVETPTQNSIGFLSITEEMPTGKVPEGFLDKLVALVEASRQKFGHLSFIQYRGGYSK